MEAGRIYATNDHLYVVVCDRLKGLIVYINTSTRHRRKTRPVAFTTEDIVSMKLGTRVNIEPVTHGSIMNYIMESCREAINLSFGHYKRRNEVSLLGVALVHVGQQHPRRLQLILQRHLRAP